MGSSCKKSYKIEAIVRVFLLVDAFLFGVESGVFLIS